MAPKGTDETGGVRIGAMTAQQPVADQTPAALDAHRARAMRTPVLTGAWVLLLLLGVLFLFAPIADLRADLGSGIPSDHLAAFSHVAGVPWMNAVQSAPGLTRYVTLLEIAYALHELVFGLLFLVVVAIPFRRGMRWAWWACWAPLIATIGYSLTFGRSDPTLLTRSLIPDIALPILLLVHIPAFFGRSDRPS